MLPEPPDGYYGREYAEPLLRAFLGGTKDDPPPPLPRRADPAQVDELVAEVLAQDDPTTLEVDASSQLMRFYALEQRAEQLPALLNRTERNDAQFTRSLRAVALLADFGDADMQKQAADYLQYLATHFLAPSYYPALVNLLHRLPEDTDEQIMVTPIKNKMTELKPKLETDDDALIAHRRLEQLLEDRLPAVLQVRKRQQQILKTVDDKHRRRDIGRCYLRFDRSPYVDLRDWAVMLLQRDCKANEPAQLAEAFVAGFELLMASASRKGVLAPGDEEDLKVYVTSCARAVEFYHGQLKPPQQEYADQHNNEEQSDILYWDPDKSKEAVKHPPEQEPPPETQPGAGEETAEEDAAKPGAESPPEQEPKGKSD